jgi:heme-degrading monooxygenase HmoA
MIARIWRGTTLAADAAAYNDYLRGTGLKAYRSTPGNRGAWILWREVGDRAEFLAVSFWVSHEAIRAFAGDDIEQAVFYPEDDRFLVERGPTAEHYQVAGGIDFEAIPQSRPSRSPLSLPICAPRTVWRWSAFAPPFLL